jgi:hypothetical protein
MDISSSYQKALPLTIQFIMAVPLLGLLCILTFIGLIPTGAPNPGCMEKFARLENTYQRN